MLRCSKTYHLIPHFLILSCHSLTTSFSTVSLIGIVTKDEPYLIVLEFMHLGSLSGYLKSEFVRGKLEGQRLIKMAGDICAGMYYLANMGFVVSTHLSSCAVMLSIVVGYMCSSLWFLTNVSMHE